MAMEKQLIPMAQVLFVLRGLCAQGETGAFFVATESGHWAEIVLEKGDVIGLRFRNRKGLPAAQALAQVTQAKYSFSSVNDVSMYRHTLATEEIPSTEDLLQMLMEPGGPTENEWMEATGIVTRTQLGPPELAPVPPTTTQIPTQPEAHEAPRPAQPAPQAPAAPRPILSQPRAPVAPRPAPAAPAGQVPQRPQAPQAPQAPHAPQTAQPPQRPAPPNLSGTRPAAPSAQPQARPVPPRPAAPQQPGQPAQPPTQPRFSPTQTQTQAPPAPTPGPNAKKVLVVEDSTISRTVITRTLSRRGYKIIEAEDGFQALAQLTNEMPDLVLLDLIMPGMDGYKVLSHMKKKPEFAKIPVIILTSRDTLFDKLRGKMSGSDEYLTKPFSSTELLEKVEAYLV